MPTQVQFRRGTTTQVGTFTGAAGEVVYDTEQKTLSVQDGTTSGGTYLATKQFANSAFEVANAAYSIASGVISFTGTATLTDGPYNLTLDANGVVNFPTGVSGYAVIQGVDSVQIVSNTNHWTFGTDGTTTLPGTISSNLIPTTANSKTLGSSAKPWHDLYIGTGNVNIGGIALSNNNGILTITGASDFIVEGAPNKDIAFIANTANAAFNTLNVVTIVANAAFDKANSANMVAQAGFDKANAANVLAQTTFDYANNILVYAQSAYQFANGTNTTLSGYISNVFANANNTLQYSQSAYALANSVNAYSYSAYNKANNALANTTGTFGGSLTITGQANVQQRLAVGTGSYTVLPNLIAQFTGSSDTYSQINQQNLSANGSGDIVVTAPNGTDLVNYIDMGVAGNTYNNQAYNSWSMAYPNDGWLMVEGNPGQNFGGNVFIGTSTSGTGAGQVGDIVFIQGGNYEEVGRFALGKGLVVNSTTASSSNSTGALVVKGGVGIKGAVYADSVYDNGVRITTGASDAYLKANGAFDKANSANVIAQAAYDSGNSTLTYAQSGYAKANAANVLAQAAFDKANTKFNSSGGTISGDTSITGNLTVTGTTFYANTVNLVVEDNIITLNSNVTGTPALNAGFEVNRGNQSNTSLVWNETGKNWQFTEDGTNYKVIADAANVSSAYASGNNTLTYATAGFNKANLANVLAQNAYDSGNSTLTYATAGFNKANLANVLAQAAFDSGNNTLTYATAGFGKANTANVTAQAAFDFANSVNTYAFSAYASGNSTLTYATAGFNKANGANVIAQAAFDFANSVNTYAFSAYASGNSTLTYATAGFNKANTANVTAQAAYDFGNTVNTYAFSAYSHSNNTLTYATAGFDKANAANVLAQSAYDSGNNTLTYATAGFNKANAANVLAQSAYDSGNNTLTYATAGFGKANAANVLAQSAYDSGNATATYATAGFNKANTANVTAQAAYDNANTKFASAGGTITGPTTIAANVTISGNNNLTVTGNLNVLGYTTTSYTNSLTLSNAMFNLHTSNTLGQLTTNDGLNIGMAFHYYDTADKQAILVRENSTGYLIWYNTSTNLVGNTDSKGITMGTFQTDALIANTVTANGIELYAFTTSAYNSGNNTLTYATAGFNKANAANVLAQSAYDSGNSTLTYATAGFNKANAANVIAQAGFDFANSVNTYAYSAYASGNSTLTYATAGFNKANLANVLAQSAYDSGNSTLTYATAGFNKANVANVLAQSSYDFANTVNTYAFSAYSYANATNTLTVSSYNKANAANVLAQAAYDSGNSTLTYATAGFAKANAANVLAQAAYDSGNSTLTYAQAGYTKANGAVQSAFVTVSANGNSITPSSNNDTLTITAASANGINVLNPSSKTIDFGLRTSGVTAGNYGSSTNIPVISVDAFGRITSASNSSISTSISLSGTSGTGSVSGGGTLTFSGNYGVTASASGSTITIATPQDLQTTASPSFNNLNVTGNLSIGGAYTYTNTAIYQTVDSLIELAANNAGDAVDIGFYGQYNSSGNKYAGLARSAGSTFVLFKDLSSNPTTNSVGSITLANYGTLRANLTGGMVSGLANTIGISDGGTNNSTYTTGALLQYNGTGIVSLANTGVSAGSYGNTTSIPSITVDAYGRVTAVSNNTISTSINLAANSGTGSVSGGGTLTLIGNTGIATYSTGSTIYINNTGVTSLATGSTSRITVSAATGNISIDLATTAVTAGSYNYANITVDSYGRVTSAVTGTPVTSFSGGTTGLTPATGTNGAITLAGTLGISNGGSNNTSFTTGQIIYYNGSSLTSLANSGVTAGSYGNTTTIPSITVDALGRVTAVSNNVIYVPPGTSITANSGQLTANSATGNVALGLATTTVSAGTYGSSSNVVSITVDSYGRITSASNVAVTATAAIVSATDTFTGNGVQTAFVLAQTPYNKDSTTVNINGVTQQRSTYSVTGSTLTLTTAAPSGAVVEVTTNYNALGSGTITGALASTVDTFTADGATGAYTLTTTPSGINYTFVHVNGVQQNRNTYTLVGNVVTLGGVPTSGAIVEVQSFTSTSGVVVGLTNYGAANNAVYSSSSNTLTSGTLPINAGGSNATSYTSGQILYYNGTNFASLANSTASGSYTNASVTVDAYGRVTSASSGTTAVTSVSGTTGQIFSSGGTTPTLNLANTAVTTGTYGGATQIPVIAVDQFGRITSAANAAITVGTALTDDTTSATVHYPLMTVSTSGSIAIANTSSTKLSYVPSTGTLSATTFSGTLSGSATSATSATNAVNTTNANTTGSVTTNSTYYPSFVASNSSSSQGLNTATALTFNPSTGTLSATVHTSTSDETLKENIAPITNALDIINNIDGVKFNWKDNGNPSAGLIAQQVEQYLPELITTADGKKSLNYNGIVAVLVEAIKAQQVQIDALTKKKKVK